MKELTVLSLFDGIACGRVALERAGIPVKRYIASEIEPNAIKVAMSNYPDIEQIGDVTKIDVNSLPEIDLLIGGSPCQGFSVMGKQQNFEDPRSRLFWEYVKILKATKPKYFLLENVKMKQEYSDIISEALGVEPRIINSRLVSGQNRVRAYWTNLEVAEVPDKNISFQDILESGYTNRDKSLCLLESENCLCISSADLYRRNKTKSQGNIVFFSKDFDPEKGVRMLTQYEVERLQTLPNGYTRAVNRNIAAGLCGNGWTVDVIAHILSAIPKEGKAE